MSIETAPELLPALRARLEEMAASVDPASLSGRGIVIPAGGAGIFVNAYVLVHLLRRHLACTLPIEVWHVGPGELSPRMKSLLHGLDVATVDAAPLLRAAGIAIADGWQLKPFAALASRFAEVLLLDADQVPARDPEELFGWPHYLASGAVFWPDILDIRADNPIWPLLGLPAERRVSVESGQVLIDKRRHWRALAMTVLINTRADLVYDLVYGDKDTFLLGWLATGADHVMAPHRPFADDRTLTQRDFSGAVLFQHRTNCKWTYSGAPHVFPGIIHEAACRAALKALRAQWNGRIFTPPPRSARAHAAEADLVRLGGLRGEVVADDRFRLELLSENEIGEGRSFDRQNWHVADDPAHASGLALILTGTAGLAYRLSPGPDGTWTGERLRAPRAPVSLIPEAAAPSAEAVPGDRPGLVDQFLAAATDRDRDGLQQALILLARIEPEVEARLRVRAAQCPADSPEATRLAALAEAVAAEAPPSLVPPKRPLDLFQERYVAVPERPFGWQA